MTTSKTTPSKRLLSLVLTVAMLCGLVPLSTFAQDGAIPDEAQCTCQTICTADSVVDCTICAAAIEDCTGQEVVFEAPGGEYLPRVPQTNRLRSSGGPVVTNEADFDIFLSADGSYGDAAAFSEKVKGYLDSLILQDGANLTSRINTTSANIDPTDLTKWYVYDHYDTKWYSNKAAWTANYMTDTASTHPDIPKNWYYYPVSDSKAGGNNATFTQNGAAGKMTIADIQAGAPTTASWGRTAFLREHIGTGKDQSGAPFMQFYGYYSSINADFLFYPASATSEKKVVFDVDASKVLPHSLASAGFLINVGLDDKNTPQNTADDTMNGYLMLITYKSKTAGSDAVADEVASVELWRLNNAPVDTLHSGGMRALSSSQKELVATSNFKQAQGTIWPFSRIELSITPTSLQATIQELDSNGTLQGSGATNLFSNQALVSTGAGGFGPFVDMAVTGHTCDTTSTYRFSNLQMSFSETLVGNADLEALQYADFLEKGKQKYFVNLMGDNGEYGKYNRTDAERTPNDIDKAYLNQMKDQKIILVADKGTDTDPQIYPETYLGANKKAYTNANDLIDGAKSYADDEVYLGNPTGLDEKAAQIAWVIYHNPTWNTSGGGTDVVVPETVAKAELLLMDSAQAATTEQPDPWKDAAQVNEVRKELIQDKLKIFINPDKSLNVTGTWSNNGIEESYTLVPSYTLSKPDGTSMSLVLTQDPVSGKSYFEVDKTWANGSYSVTLNYALGGPVTTVVPATTKFHVSTDTVAPTVTKPSGVTTTADGKITATIGVTNTPSTGENSYTSDLAYYAVVVNTTQTPAAASTITNKVAITTANPMPTTFTNDTASATGSYYVHVYVWDAAGNANVATSDKLTITKISQTTDIGGNVTDDTTGTVTGEAGKTYYVLELGKDTNFPLNVTSTSLPNATKTYAVKNGTTFITMDSVNGTVSPAAVGKAQVTVTIAGNAQYNDAVVDVTVVVVPPLRVNLAVTGYDSTKVTIKPTYKENILYPMENTEPNKPVLEYREATVGPNNNPWITIADWNWDTNKEIPFAGLKPGTSYEAKVTAKDTRPDEPTTASATITFKTPAKPGDENGAGGGNNNGSVDVEIDNIPPNKDVIITIEKGGDVISSVTKPGTPSGGNVDVSFDKLPDGIYNIVIEDEDGNKRTEEVEIKNGVTTPGKIIADYEALAEKETVLVFDKEQSTAPAPELVAGGLNDQYDHVNGNTDDKKGITQNDLDVINAVVDGKKGSARIELIVRGVAQNDMAAKDDIAMVKTAAKGQLIAQMFDATLWKIITPAAQLARNPVQMMEANERITLYMPVPKYVGHSLKLYRVHEDGTKTVDEIPMGATKTDGTANTEYFTLENGMIVLHVKKFSLYAFTYTPYSSDDDSSSGDATYPVKPEKDPDGGSITTDKGSSKPGSDVTITVKPDEGYVLDDIIVKDKDGNNVPVKDKGNGEFTFTMPDSAVTITPIFREELASLDKTGVGKKLNAADHIRYLQGDDLGTFRPLANMTRAEVAQMFYNLLLDKSVVQTVTFSDVNAEAWYAKAVHTLASMGIVEGYAGAYRPMEPITRAEFTAIAVRFANEQAGRVKFTDVPESHWAYKAIGTAAHYGWIKGSDGKFSPNLNISRAEVATIVNRMLVRIADKAYITGNLNTVKIFPDAADQNYWAWLDIVESTNAHDFKNDGKEVWTGLQQPK